MEGHRGDSGEERAVSLWGKLCFEREERNDRRAGDYWRSGKGPGPAGPWGDWILFSRQEEAPEAEEMVRFTC